MRFQRLHIPAFGPFTNLELKFPTKEYDLHLIYGENEAGKSSLLRAIRDLLFGIHGQSPDNFLHDYKDLRLVGEIVNRSGEQLVFQRRKGNRNTILDKDGKSLSDSALQPFLGSVDQSYFSTMFGLGNTELRDGAKQLLRGEGEVGNALFSASLGGTPIQRVLDSLIEESELVFKGRATTNVTIRPMVKKYKDLLKLSRNSMVSPEVWSKLEEDLAEQKVAKDTVENEISTLEREVSWISRCEDALPSVGLLSGEMKLLRELPELPEIASDFVERARSARNLNDDAKTKVETLTAHITQLNDLITACSIYPELLAEEGVLDVLHQDLGAYRTKKEALKNLQIKLAGIEPVLQAGMKSLDFTGESESLEKLRISSAVQLRCEEVANTLQEAVTKQNENNEAIEENKQNIKGFMESLKSLLETNLTPLREALAIAAEATDANKTLAVSEKEVVNLTHQISIQHDLVTSAPQDLDATAHLSVPAISTIRKFRKQFEKLEQDIKTKKENITKEEQHVTNLQNELIRQERREELPTEESLHKARGHRDLGWNLVLAEWKGNGAEQELVPNSPLEESFPKAIVKADDIADQLRQQAEAVAQAVEKHFQIKNSKEVITELKEKCNTLQNSLGECQGSWTTEWDNSGITPRSPEEMEEWYEQWALFRGILRQLREAENTVKTKNSLIKGAKSNLATALACAQEKDFLVLFEDAKIRVQKGEGLNGRRELIEEHLQAHKKQLKIFEQKSPAFMEAVNKATLKWKSQCQTVGLPENTSPDSGLILLDERKQLFVKFDEWKIILSEAEVTANAVLLYEQNVHDKAIELNTKGDTTETQEGELWKALSQARTDQAKYDQLTEQIQDDKNDLESAILSETQAVQALKELMQLVKLDTLEELESLLTNLEKRNTIQGRIDNYRESLGGLARGQPVDEFVALVQAENADELPQRKKKYESGRADKKIMLQEVRDTIGGLETNKEELEKAGDTAADFRQQAESVAATLKQDASRFVRLRLAAYSLRTQIERFREENQGPLLEKSGQVFEHITRGAFVGLDAEFNAQDIPIMVGCREDGAKVSIEGMSDGTRDQLYVALRLAALDYYLKEHEPMPLILDDLLITFDDDRTKAILPQLANLSKRTQIFLFTHHEHLVELCRQTLDEHQFTLHRLVAPYSSKSV